MTDAPKQGTGSRSSPATSMDGGGLAGPSKRQADAAASPRKSTGKSAGKPTVWRESLPSGMTERQRCYAHRAGAQLTVILRASEDDTLVTANVVSPHKARATTFRVPGDTTRRTQSAQIAVAKQWAENEADRIAAGAK